MYRFGVLFRDFVVVWRVAFFLIFRVIDASWGWELADRIFIYLYTFLSSSF